MQALLSSISIVFLERFSHSLQAWHEARLSYVRSCAVNSVIGHILGIGDRHSHNILVHQKTGEVVHIDFGIVFEQGKVSFLITACLLMVNISLFSLIYLIVLLSIFFLIYIDELDPHYS